MIRNGAMSDKIIVLGVDGLDPKLAKKYLAMGIMPNLQKIIDRGACRDDLMLLGGHPTITPPMWTTLGTGCYSNVHGIDGYYIYKEGDPLDVLSYGLDSRDCKAEPVWNCFAEAGKKTLVWHWPGGSWPPTSDSENLMVVDGSSPGSVGAGKMEKDNDHFIEASAEYTVVNLVKAEEMQGTPACTIGFEESEANENGEVEMTAEKIHLLIMEKEQRSGAFKDLYLDTVQSPIKDAVNWEFDIPKEAKEFTLLFSNGKVRRVGLIIKNEQGIFNRVLLYKNKKIDTVLAELNPGEFTVGVVDDGYKESNHYMVSRNIKLMKLSEDGTYLKIYVSHGMDTKSDAIFWPKSLKDEIYQNVGYLPSSTMIGNQSSELITECMLNNWDIAVDWQARALNYMIEKYGVEIIFSHQHNIDLQMHLFVGYMSGNKECKLPVDMYDKFAQDIYKQTDRYLGEFVHLLDKGWSMFIVSDHGLVSHRYDVPGLCDGGGLNVRVMQELGYTVLKTDENGNELAEVDWSKTTAVALGELRIIINLKGRNTHGIVDPADKWELEEKIITDLYGYRDKETGKRIVAVALRSKDAILLGEGEPYGTGDIYYWLAEGYTFDHGDMLSTSSEGDTSASPIFIAAGKGIKENYKTDRIIREVDLAPTVAVLGGVRMPKTCEGAPVYQIFAEEF